jgi:hypothetical protein
MTENWCNASPQFLIDIIRFFDILRKIINSNFMTGSPFGKDRRVFTFRCSVQPTGFIALAAYTALRISGKNFMNGTTPFRRFRQDWERPGIWRPRFQRTGPERHLGRAGNMDPARLSAAMPGRSVFRLPSKPGPWLDFNSRLHYSFLQEHKHESSENYCHPEQRPGIIRFINSLRNYKLAGFF